MRRCFHLLAAVTRRSLHSTSGKAHPTSKSRGATVATAKKALQLKRKEEEDVVSGGSSFAATFPTYASLWVRATSNKLIQPHHIPYNSKKLAVWRCPSCAHQFKERVYLYVAAGGRCPSCGVKPSLHGSATNRATKGKSGGGLSPFRAEKDHKKVAAAAVTSDANENATVNNKEAKSIADSNYLVVNEKRNLQPMLAKNFEKEMSRIDLANEALFVSPKLDGIRCIVGYDKRQKAILFFSRAGTLFECCDAKIEPALRYVFEHIDPNLVLDGELYNSSENGRQMATLCTAAHKARRTSSSSNNSSESALAAYYQHLYETQQKEGGAVHKANASGAKNGKPIPFEALVSAIRTTREKRTPEVEQLQRLLQYHIFDVLYASHFPSCNGGNVRFSERYAFLKSTIAKVQAHNKKSLTAYDADVLQVVPSVPVDGVSDANGKGVRAAKKGELSPEALTTLMDSNIRTAMSLGFEGIMLRREDTSTQSVANAKKSILRAKTSKKKTAGSPFGGYEHGKRSSCLLKYKKMQDAEFIIVSAVEGKGKLKGSLGAFVCEVPSDSSSASVAAATTPNRKNKKYKNNKNDSKLFYVTPATSEENKKKMWQQWRQRKAYSGKALTVQFQDLSKEGIPRFPIGKCIRGAADGKDWL